MTQAQAVRQEQKVALAVLRGIGSDLAALLEGNHSRRRGD